MANKITDNDLTIIEEVIRRRAQPVSASEILRALPTTGISRRTLQYRLKRLVLDNRLIMEAKGRWTTYHLADIVSNGTTPDEKPAFPLALSVAAKSVRHYVQQAVEARTPVGYQRDFLDRYHPNVTFYLTETERAHLASVGQRHEFSEPAGTYAKQILSRLLVDLSWNSSRLEGNTYSLLDTKRLIEFGKEADEHDFLEAQMILNHKYAIEFLVSAAADISFNRYTILNLHALLSSNLLADPSASGRLRYFAVGIAHSTFYPLEVPQLIEEIFDQLLATARAIVDPFEQAFFLLVHLPYLQPFDDVNKRVSRLAANIPLIKANLTPLSFIDVPRQIYTEAMLGVYELNKVNLLKDLFLWAYERSATRYAAVQQSLGKPDPFKFRYRTELNEIVAKVIRAKISRQAVTDYIRTWTADRVNAADYEHFVEVTEIELMALHEGNFARYHVQPTEFAAWQEVWNAK